MTWFSKSVRNQERQVRRSSSTFTVISVFLWVVIAMSTSFYWPQVQPLYVTSTLFTLSTIYFSAAWACWISLFGFVCSVHRIQAEEYVDDMRDIYKKSLGSEKDEKRCIAELITSFQKMQESWKNTGQDFSLIISFSVASHVFDINMKFSSSDSVL